VQPVLLFAQGLPGRKTIEKGKRPASETIVRKSFFITAFVIAFALSTLLLLAFNQFQLYGRHEQIISQTERLTFQYSNIREQIIEDIVQGRLSELAQISSAVEELHNSIITLLDNPLIPAEYKFSFMQQIDLPGLVLLLRRSGTEQEDKNLLRRIVEETRIIGERFMLLERLVLGYAKQKLVDFQAIVIGTLALVVFLVTTLLVITYRFLIQPVVNLTAQAESVLQGTSDRLYLPGGWREVSGLADRMNQLLLETGSSREAAVRLGRILQSCSLVAGKIRESEGTTELCQLVCRYLLTNPDYILVWIGTEEGGGAITPIAADGSSTMTGKECQECFGALLAAQEGKNDPAVQVMRTGETVLRQDILAGAPMGPFKNTPMASGVVDSISLPIGRSGELFGVLTVYAMAKDGIQDLEVKALAELAEILDGRLTFFKVLKRLELEKRVKNCIGEKTDIISLVLDQEGIIRGADTYLSASPNRKATESWVGGRVSDIVRPLSEPEKVMLNAALTEKRRYDFNAELVGIGGIFSAILTPVGNHPVDKESLLLVLMPPQKDIMLQPENLQIAYSSAVGQFASTIAHEITDLSNGIINYAQMLSDEMTDEPASELRKHLDRIIAGGEKVAAVVEPLLVEQHDVEYASDLVEVRAIVDEVFNLAGYVLRKDGITVHYTVHPPTLQYRRQYLRLILLTLLNSLRAILNSHYPQKDPAKGLTLSILQFMEGGAELIRISVPVPWTTEGESVQDAFPSEFRLNKELVRNMGGEMKFSPEGQNKMKIELILPC
jgi:nitrogen-specific signal transduction histidine kinase